MLPRLGLLSLRRYFRYAAFPVLEGLIAEAMPKEADEADSDELCSRLKILKISSLQLALLQMQ